MDSLPIPPITRFDAVMWFLRVQLWVSVVVALLSTPVLIDYLSRPLMSIPSVVRALLIDWLPVVILLAFPSVLASNSLGQSREKPVVSLGDCKALTLRCIGLVVFVNFLGTVALVSLFLIYDLATNSSTFASKYLFFGNVRELVLAFLHALLGFVLAFGPAIRDSLQPR